MITVDKAIEIVTETVQILSPITIPFEDSLGFCLAEDVISDIDMPPFNRSAMDGYAVIADDTVRVPVELPIIEDIAAGYTPSKKITPGNVSKIMTGASVPEGADAVVKFEDTESLSPSNLVRILKPIEKGKNISQRGEDIQAGQRVLHKGMQVRPQEIGIMATVGKSKIAVHPAPSIAIISTGDELVGVEDKPSPGQIRNSNGYSLSTQARRLQAKVELLGIVKDKKDEIANLINEGLQRDILILSGGVSMGEYDLVGEVMKEIKVQIYFEKVALKPGKPVVFGKKDNTLIFALPGNPVASFVTFELFIYPAIRKLMGFSSLHRMQVKATLGEEIVTKRKRREFRPASYTIKNNAWYVSPTEWHGSADLLATTRANCLLIIPEDSKTLANGQLVDIIILD